jgi:ATP-dependent RNA helicase DeaD
MATRPRRRRRVRRADDSTTTRAPVLSLSDAQPAEGFRHLDLSEMTLRALGAMGYEQPTEIQEQAIPAMIEGRDVVGQAQTGTGKTAAFGVPLVEWLDPDVPEVQALVLVPTRELCTQVARELTRICAGSGLKVAAIYGGAKMGPQLAALAEGAQIVVGTPGRIQDHLWRNTLSLDAVRIAILDEADEMLDIGFAEDMERILRHTPKERRTALFSATMPPFIQRMIKRYMRNPVFISIEPEQATVDSIDQVYYEVSERDKVEALLELLESRHLTRVLVFRNTQIGVDRLASALKRHGISALPIHGGMRQRERDRVMHSFRSGDLHVLVATNVAARGLDIRAVSHVVNYDFPQSTEEYIHRIGRTGRAGAAGTAITFVSEWDYDYFEQLCDELGDAPRRELLSLYEQSA